MINLTLFKKEWLSNWKIIVIFICILSLYMGMILYMYNPDLSALMNSMMEAMPGIFDAVGMSYVGNRLIDFCVQYLYGFILLVFPSVFIIIVSNKLICKYVDTGSMAYLLASPNKRRKICLTQWFSLNSFVLALIAYITIFSIIVSNLLFPNELDIQAFLLLNVGLFALYFFISSFCFMISCCLNESDKVIGICGAFLFLSYVFQAISNMGDKTEFFQYLTFLNLFQPITIINNFSEQLLPLGGLFLGGLLMSVIGIIVFSKRDLPL